MGPYSNGLGSLPRTRFAVVRRLRPVRRPESGDRTGDRTCWPGRLSTFPCLPPGGNSYTRPGVADVLAVSLPSFGPPMSAERTDDARRTVEYGTVNGRFGPRAKRSAAAQALIRLPECGVARPRGRPIYVVSVAFVAAPSMNGCGRRFLAVARGAGAHPTFGGQRRPLSGPTDLRCECRVRRRFVDVWSWLSPLCVDGSGAWPPPLVLLWLRPRPPSTIAVTNAVCAARFEARPGATMV